MHSHCFRACLAAITLLTTAAHAAPAVTTAEPFPLTQVRLLPGPFLVAQKMDAQYLLSLDTERLVHNFKVNAGLPSDAKPYGGWEGSTVQLRGHFVGHYLSACALMYASTGDVRFKQRAVTVVSELAQCQKAIGTGYLSAFPASAFDTLEAGGRYWAPYYTIHKIMAGLLDTYQECGDPQALEVLKGMSGYFKGRVDKLSDAQMARVMRTEFGGMMEVLANEYAVTHNPDDLALAMRFDDHSLFDPLAAQADPLTGLHANTQFPKIIGAARVYELTDIARYHAIAEYFWTDVVNTRSFVTGGNSFHEHFDAPGIEATQLAPDTSETCNTYNMLKLTRHLFEWKPSAIYADYYERALFNHILGSIDPDSGTTTYYYSLKPGHFKVYGDAENAFWCCTGTGAENHAKYGDSIYFHNAQNLWVNLFIASELRWPERGVSVTQQTSFPQSDKTRLVFHAARPATFTLNLRVPYWATNGAKLTVNGRPVTVLARPQSYVAIKRAWKTGDVVEWTLPMRLHLYHAPDSAQAVAVLYGPLVLAGNLGRDNMPVSDHARDPHALDKVIDPAPPALMGADANLPSWIKAVPGQPLTFHAQIAGNGAPITLEPLYQIHHDRYTVYWTLAPRAASRR